MVFGAPQLIQLRHGTTGAGHDKFDAADWSCQCGSMNSSVCRQLWLVLICLGLTTGTARATTFLTLQSTYLGEGWFQYQMVVMNDPFFSEADVAMYINITNQIDQVDGTNGWSYQGSDGWEFTNGYPARPYSEIFLVQSSETSYRLGSGPNFAGATVTFSLFLTDLFPGIADGTVSENIVGYANVPCLIPCSPEEADGSPTNFSYNLKLVPDVQLNQLILTNGNVYGVDFNWSSQATFLLQGSPDLNSWTNVAYLWSDPPETAWTTNTPLNPYGQFFRIELVGDGYQTNLPPLSSAVRAAKAAAKPHLTTTPLRVTNCHSAGGKVLVSVAAQPGQAVQVQAINQRGVVLQSQQVVAWTSSVTVNFDSASLPNPVFFQAATAP